MTDTIYALASARGKAGVAVIRVSGGAALESLRVLAGVRDFAFRHALLRKIVHPVSRETLDHALVIAFQAPHSYTGEDVVEYHLHGGLAVIHGVLGALESCAGHRMAEPGEFTRRAFENGKMDLTEAEAVADLINAETQMQKVQAMAQMGGVLSALYDGWREDLTKILAHVEADLEFPDEDLPEGILPQVLPRISNLAAQIDAHLNDRRRGERLRDGISIVIIGAPNVGKSSLMNLLSRRDIAIVSDLAGTTRDIIEAHLDIGGYPVILSDTAGLRPDQLGNEGHDLIESEGMRRALLKAQEADIRILLYDATAEDVDPYTKALEGQGCTVSVLNKCDKGVRCPHGADAVKISVATGQGVEQLLAVLEGKIQDLIGVREAPALTQARHRAALDDCRAALERSMHAALPELAAEDLRLAIRDLGRIVGRVDVEDLLDVVFRDFCIGK